MKTGGKSRKTGGVSKALINRIISGKANVKNSCNKGKKNEPQRLFESGTESKPNS